MIRKRARNLNSSPAVHRPWSCASLACRQQRRRQRAFRQQAPRPYRRRANSAYGSQRAVPFRVVGVFYDYGDEAGYILLARSTLLRYLPDPAASNLAVYLAPGADLETVRAAIRKSAAGSDVLIFSNREIRRQGIRVFDQTFAITYALEAVAILVAVLGIAGALISIVIDRRREFGLLRFLGAATSQIRRIILVEAGLIGILANIVGLALGYLLSLILIYVINKQSFGWTIRFHWPVSAPDRRAQRRLSGHRARRPLPRLHRPAPQPH